MLERAFRQFSVNLQWQSSDILISFEVAAFINSEDVSVSV